MYIFTRLFCLRNLDLLTSFSLKAQGNCVLLSTVCNITNAGSHVKIGNNLEILFQCMDILTSRHMTSQ